MEHLHINNLWINGLLQAFAQLGLDTDALGKGIEGISDGKLAQGHQLDLVDARTLWHRAVKQCDDPLLGVNVGLIKNPRASGVLMPILLHSPTTRAALEHVAQFQTLISESGHYRIHDPSPGSITSIEYEYMPATSSVSIHSQQVMSVITSTLMMVKMVSSDRIDANTLYVPPGMDTSAISEALACEVETREGNLAIRIPSADLDTPIVGRDEHLYQLSLGYAEGLLRAKRAGQHLIDQIKSAIDVEQPAQVSIEDVSAELDLHHRGLQRNLKEQGTSFRQLKESLLKERTLELLVSQRLDIDTIAEQLGYSDASTFHRAFKSWFDVTPKQFREQIGS